MKSKTIIELKDNHGRGDIKVVLTKDGVYEVWAEIDDIGGAEWTMFDQFNSLSDAMDDLAKVIKTNVDHGFYDDEENGDL